MIEIRLYQGLVEKKNIFGIPIEFIVIFGALIGILYLMFWSWLVVIPVIILYIATAYISKKDMIFILIYLNNIVKNPVWLGF
ncbi:hypothetical protein EII29_02465 [Leptotrichia sp. OH3620_COT-345]|uniref:VirB3 family type IV secretion system protein n=1 Tax=Leptotrichia sp. OH3620_COT-345 TaxID=2491048 RepID=UPI000F651CB3|nr:VirB3 family type IV secretion system protein [Leptotrichia sp. OH3620_COT-345]RRD40362.1 hypothetical protein EII29_02465 [Leptotrichia sp. OH3620_COT-345]